MTEGQVSVIALAGPTACGKSEAALELASSLGGEIVSCDSIAVYRGFDIGSAKPGDAERERITHHLIDVVDPDEPFTAARYVAMADRSIAEIAGRGRAPIVVGGTGLYLRALLEGLFDSPPPDPEVRAGIKRAAAESGWPALHERLAAVDPEAAARIAPVDPVRIERALEVYIQTGTPLTVLQRAQPRRPRYRSLIVLIDPPRDTLEVRIAHRVQRMLSEGLVDETRRLAERWGRAVKPLGSVGYREALLHLDGEIAADALAEAIRIATRRFAKRQRNWFARTSGIRVASAAELPLGESERFLAASGTMARHGE